jgi:hypothetical protein
MDSPDSAVGIATGYGPDDRGVGVWVPVEQQFSFLHVQTDSGVHPLSYTMDIGGLSPGVKRPVCEADHSTPTSLEVKKNLCVYIHSHTVSWHSTSLVKHRDNFTSHF